MKVINKKHFKQVNVAPNGTFTDGRLGAIKTAGGVTMSDISGGCGMGNCNCSPGHWICITQPLKNGIVEGVTIYFNNRRELEIYTQTIEYHKYTSFMNILN